jgi:putative spermidine/putrescine transport system permease protein
VSGPGFSPPSLRTPAQRAQSAALYVYCALVLVFLVAPILAIVPLSFSAGTLLTYPLPGLSLRWYHEILTSERWLTALRNSLGIGIASTASATILGTLAALGLNHARIPFRRLIMGLVLSPMIVPTVITAVGLYFFFAPLHLVNSFAGLVLAHTALGVPFVVITVGAALEGFDTNLARAGAILGAPPLTVFFRVTLPLILPGVAAGMVFAFATSFDEVVVVLLLAGPEQHTLPREMFIGVREQINPSITAIAVVMIFVSIALLLSIEALRRRAARLRGTA